MSQAIAEYSSEGAENATKGFEQYWTEIVLNTLAPTTVRQQAVGVTLFVDKLNQGWCLTQ